MKKLILLLLTSLFLFSCANTNTSGEKKKKKSIWEAITQGTGDFNPAKKGSKKKIKIFTNDENLE